MEKALLSSSCEVVPPPRECRWKSALDMWLSDDPPWDPEILENVKELGWRLEDLQTRFGTVTE